MTAPLTKSQLTTHPVIEIFGPTLQGEGILVGQPVHFIRFGGCDYRCSWCDSKFAVLPDEVRRNSVKMTDQDIVNELNALEGAPEWIVLSGGNPALQHLDGLVDSLHDVGYRLTIETQGTVFRPWLTKLDSVTVSPKGPSSGNVTSMEQVERFRNEFVSREIEMATFAHRLLSYKVVVFDYEDLEYLRELVRTVPRLYPIFLSIGTDVDNDVALDLIDKWRTWAEYLTRDPELGRVRVLAQTHVLLWGQQRGV